MNCVITGEPIQESEPHFKCGGVHISLKGVDRLSKAAKVVARNYAPPKAIEYDPEYTQQQNDLYKGFMEWIAKHAPEVNKMSKPITIEQYLILKGEKNNSQGDKVEITRKECQQYLLQIENNKDYIKKYNSPYLCILAWHKNNQK